MGAKSTSGNKNTGNPTGKSGNASGPDVKEATGGSYEQSGRGKHPKNKIYTGPKDMHDK